MATKTFRLNPVKVVMQHNGFPKGLVLKRDLTIQECKHILRKLLGIEIGTRQDYYDNEEYQDQLNEYCSTVNAWLRGDVEDDSIMDFAFDCSDEQLGLMNMLPILDYLQKKEII